MKIMSECVEKLKARASAEEIKKQLMKNSALRKEYKIATLVHWESVHMETNILNYQH
jgi:hypothetical protein